MGFPGVYPFAPACSVDVRKPHLRFDLDRSNKMMAQPVTLEFAALEDPESDLRDLIGQASAPAW